MAVNFQLLSRHYPDAPVSLIGVDEAICKMLGVEPDPKLYRSWWYDIIGFRLALGQDWGRIRRHIMSLHRPDDTLGERAITGELLMIAEFIDANYVPVSFWSR